MTKVLITGGAGFVGHHLIEHIIKNTDWDIINIDKLSYSSNGFDKLKDIKCYNTDRVKTLTCDLALPIPEGINQEIGQVDYILHIAAESHVDNSIVEPVPFIQNNVNNVLSMLEFARKRLGTFKKFLYFSTDEVYGTATMDSTGYKEGDRHNPGNPYSASKSAAEMICRAYANTYKIPIIITNAMNIIGERQHPEKYLPKIINYVLDDKLLSIHGTPDKKHAGLRHYLHARTIADEILFILQNTDEVLDCIDASKGCFNIVGEKEFDNLAFAQLVASCVGKELKYEIVDFHSSRPGHDLRYALNGDKLKNYGFVSKVPIEESIKKIVEWSLLPENKRWLGR